MRLPVAARARTLLVLALAVGGCSRSSDPADPTTPSEPTIVQALRVEPPRREPAAKRAIPTASPAEADRAEVVQEPVADPGPAEGELGTTPTEAPDPDVPVDRRIMINGVELTPERWETLARLEKKHRRRLPDGAYWYDRKSGAFGKWGGPARAVIRAGLDLGPRMPASCSGGRTGIFVNGRRIQAVEKRYLEGLLGAAISPGRYFLDARGNAGVVGGPPTVNVVAAAQHRAAQGGGRGEWGILDRDNGSFAGGWTNADGSSCKYIDTPSGGFTAGNCG